MKLASVSFEVNDIGLPRHLYDKDVTNPVRLACSACSINVIPTVTNMKLDTRPNVLSPNEDLQGLSQSK